MINYEWVAYRSGVRQMYPAKTEIEDTEGNLLVTAYAVKRPDRRQVVAHVGQQG